MKPLVIENTTIGTELLAHNTMQIALAQLNPIVGDLSGNRKLILDAANQAARAGAQLLVTSELVISGYPPKDLLQREGFAAACDRAVSILASELPQNLGVLVGHASLLGASDGSVSNAASLLHQGEITATVRKCLLPNYDVFDERRYFRPAETTAPIEFLGRRWGVHICEDAWFGEPGTTYHLTPDSHRDPVAELAAAGVDCFINLSASPFEIDKPHRREALIGGHVARHQRPFLFVNQVGGNDDLVFDGNSMAVNAEGEVVVRLKPFESDLQLLNLDALPAPLPAFDRPRPADLLDALILGLKDYAHKCGFSGCVLGLSGGIDSALACYIGVQAFGAKNVHGLALPSRYSSGHSVSDAAALAKNLGVDFEVIAIDDVHRAYESTPIISSDLLSQPGGLADQNLQARIRGASVMIRSNRHGWLALATGNKSELAVGYCTLYGDMAGGFAVLSDVFKRDVYAMSHYINDVRERREVIPVSSLTKAPSAELAPDQFDQDVLPPYPVLDAILEGLIEQHLSIATLSRQFPIEIVRWVASRLDRNEFKRRQMPPGIKLSQRAFGSGRRMPMAAKFDWE
jgi:NAD+ synthase (glutamine-hydrolysing)